MRTTWIPRFCGCALLAISVAPAWGQNNPPVVSNVTASQRTDGSKIVDIRHNLADADDDACTVTVQASTDGGATWTAPITSFVRPSDVGSGITPGANRQTGWPCAAVSFPHDANRSAKGEV